MLYYLTSSTIDSKWSSSPLPNSTEKVCTPLVFYTKNVWKPNGNGKGLIGLQVCLVEQGNELLQVNKIDHMVKL